MIVFMNKHQHDYPKKIGYLHVAWYQQGRICVSRKLNHRNLQTQNISIIQINQIAKELWQGLNLHFKKDLAGYALKYKKEYPVLRKRGISSYSVFLMLVHALLKRFSIAYENLSHCLLTLQSVLNHLSVCRAIQLKLIKPVKAYHLLNHPAGYDVVSKYESAYVCILTSRDHKCLILKAEGG